MGTGCSTDGSTAIAAAAVHAYANDDSAHQGSERGVPGSIHSFSGGSPPLGEQDEDTQQAIVETVGGGAAIGADGDSDGDEPKLSDLRKKVVLPDDWKKSQVTRRSSGGDGSASKVGSGSSEASQTGHSRLGAGRQNAPGKQTAINDGQQRGPAKGKTSTGERLEPEASTRNASGKTGPAKKARLPAEARAPGQPRPPLEDSAAGAKGRAQKPVSNTADKSKPKGQNRKTSSPFRRAESGPAASRSHVAGVAKDAMRSWTSAGGSDRPRDHPNQDTDAPEISGSPDSGASSSDPFAVLKNRLGNRRRLGSGERYVGDLDEMEAIRESASSSERSPHEKLAAAAPGQAGPGGGPENVPPMPAPHRLRASQLARKWRAAAQQGGPSGRSQAPSSWHAGSGGGGGGVGGDLPDLGFRNEIVPNKGGPGSAPIALPLSPHSGGGAVLSLPQSSSQGPGLPPFPAAGLAPGPPPYRHSRRSDPQDMLPTMQAARHSRLFARAGKGLSTGNDGAPDPPPRAIPGDALIGLRSTSYSTPVEDERFSRALALALPRLSEHLDPDAPPPPPPPIRARSSLHRRPEPPLQGTSFSQGSPLRPEPACRAGGRRLSMPEMTASGDGPVSSLGAARSPRASGTHHRIQAMLQGLDEGPHLVSPPPGWAGAAEAMAMARQHGDGTVPSPPRPQASSLNQEAVARLRNRRANNALSGGAPSSAPAAAEFAAAASAAGPGAAFGGSARASEPEPSASPKAENASVVLPEPERPATAADVKKERVLAQRASEVEIVMRLGSLTREADVEKAAAAVDRLVDLLATIDAASKRLDTENAVLYRYLLQHMAAQQAAEQKVAEKDRSPFAAPPQQPGGFNVSVLAHTLPATTEAPVWDQADTALGGGKRVEDLARSVADLRRMLRIKVQDKADLQTARMALKEAKGFFQELALHAQTRGTGQAEVLASLRAISSTPRPPVRGL